MGARLAYIADGQLRLLHEGETRGRDYESAFAAQVREREASSNRRSAWKEGGSSFAAAMARRGAESAGAQALRFVGVARGAGPGALVHALETGATSGLFLVDPDGHERRLFHSERFHVRNVASRPDGELLACAIGHGAGANIAVIRTDGTELVEITEGDSLDLAPSWVPGRGHRVAYQSAGLPRGRADAGMRRAPFSIQLVDADKGQLETLAEDPERDLMLPRMAPDGTLYYVRCPHRAPTPSLGRRVVHAVTWPVRFGQGVFAFLDLFAQAKRPGANARRAADGGAPHLDDVRMKDLLLGGSFAQDGADDESGAGLGVGSVSSAWELMRRRADGATDVVATRVFAYDVADDGTIAWTDGSVIRMQRPGGATEEIGRDHLVHDIAWLGGENPKT